VFKDDKYDLRSVSLQVAQTGTELPSVKMQVLQLLPHLTTVQVSCCLLKK